MRCAHCASRVPPRPWPRRSIEPDLDKPTMSRTERDQARLHPYHSERILSRVSALAEVAKFAGEHHERCDGTGYHRGATAVQLTLPSRVLATADAYRCLIEGRPHRPHAEWADGRAVAGGRQGWSPRRRRGRSCPPGRGHRGGPRRARPAGMTERQVAVLPPRGRVVQSRNREEARNLKSNGRASCRTSISRSVRSRVPGPRSSPCAARTSTDLGRPAHAATPAPAQEGSMVTRTGAIPSQNKGAIDKP